MVGDDPQPLGVEISQRQMADFALLLQLSKMIEGIEVALIGVVPPMKLQEIEAFDTHARQ